MQLSHFIMPLIALATFALAAPIPSTIQKAANVRRSEEISYPELAVLDELRPKVKRAGEAVAESQWLALSAGIINQELQLKWRR